MKGTIPSCPGYHTKVLRGTILNFEGQHTKLCGAQHSNCEGQHTKLYGAQHFKRHRYADILRTTYRTKTIIDNANFQHPSPVPVHEQTIRSVE